MMSLYSKLNFDLSLNKQHKSILKLVIANKGLSQMSKIVSGSPFLQRKKRSLRVKLHKTAERHLKIV